MSIGLGNIMGTESAGMPLLMKTIVVLLYPSYLDKVKSCNVRALENYLYYCRAIVGVP